MGIKKSVPIFWDLEWEWKTEFKTFGNWNEKQWSVTKLGNSGEETQESWEKSWERDFLLMSGSYSGNLRKNLQYSISLCLGVTGGGQTDISPCHEHCNLKIKSANGPIQ